mmetsp:Transcript_4674/g.18660  ORF Transcript_4674/g.18660 Transcript_4674/m.18660 type:complete len:251 (-) Transcript_4674:2594-3346(-)
MRIGPKQWEQLEKRHQDRAVDEGLLCILLDVAVGRSQQDDGARSVRACPHQVPGAQRRSSDDRCGLVRLTEAPQRLTELRHVLRGAQEDEGHRVFLRRLAKVAIRTCSRALRCTCVLVHLVRIRAPPDPSCRLRAEGAHQAVQMGHAGVHADHQKMARPVRRCLARRVGRGRGVVSSVKRFLEARRRHGAHLFILGDVAPLPPHPRRLRGLFVRRGRPRRAHARAQAARKPSRQGSDRRFQSRRRQGHHL